MRVAMTAACLYTPLGPDTESTFARLAAHETSVSSAARWGDHGPVSRFDGPVSSSELAERAIGLLQAERTIPTQSALWLASTSADMVLGEVAYGQVAMGQPPTEPLQYLWGQALHRTSRVARRLLGCSGPFGTFSTACTSGAVALLAARDSVVSGQAPAAVVVGVDALCRTTVHGFNALGVHSPTGARPFDLQRDGMSLGEAACAVLIEPLDGAVDPIAELVGGAMTSDAYHLSSPDPAGAQAQRAIAMACAQAGLDPSDVGYVSAHGTGTVINDRVEANVLARVCPGVPVASVKGALGHTLGAAGVIEAALAALGLHRGIMLPTYGLEQPEHALDHVLSTRAQPHNTALSVNFAFGGHNTALLLARVS